MLVCVRSSARAICRVISPVSGVRRLTLTEVVLKADRDNLSRLVAALERDVADCGGTVTADSVYCRGAVCGPSGAS